MAESSSTLSVRVGIFLTIAVILLLGLSFQVGKTPWGEKRYTVVGHFRQVSGIERGTAVQLRGVPIGRVDSIDWDPSSFRVRVAMLIDPKFQIPNNAVAKIQVSSLLGGNFLNISFEEGAAMMKYLSDGDDINTADTASIDEVLATFSELSSEAESLITNLNENQKKTMDKINVVIDENKQYFSETSRSFSELGPKLNNIADRLDGFTSSMEKGEGTIGKLYTDTELYEDVKSFIASAKEVGDKINSGEGDLGRLINDDALVEEARTIMTDLQRAAREVEGAISENREGMRQLLKSMSEAGPRIDAAVANFKEISEKINSTDGTLGRLINDPSLYEDAQRTINQVGESFESGEEQGVFRSFLGVIFGALI